MRAGIGLLAMLIAVVIMLLLYVGLPGMGPGYLKSVATGQKQASAFVNVLNGKDTTGTKSFDQSIQFQMSNDGHYSVYRIDKGGPAEQAYGLQVGDVVTQIGAFDVRDSTNVGTPEAFLEKMTEAYSRRYEIVIKRDDQVVTLPNRIPLNSAELVAP